MTNVPFAGLFRTDTPHGARVFDEGFRWDFDGADLNESARALFQHLDRVFEVLYAPAFAFLSTIELDAEAGRFPDVLAQYFRDDAWSDTHSFFVAPIKRVGPETSYSVGRSTFEALPGQTQRVLAQNGGFRWGARLRVWGMQVPKVEISRAIDMSAENLDHVAAVHTAGGHAGSSSAEQPCLGAGAHRCSRRGGGARQRALAKAKRIWCVHLQTARWGLSVHFEVTPIAPSIIWRRRMRSIVAAVRFGRLASTTEALPSSSGAVTLMRSEPSKRRAG